MKLIFCNTPHYLGSLMDSKNSDSNNNVQNECPASSLKVLGEPLILRNINMVKKMLNFDKVLIPNGLRKALKIVQEAFPYIDIEEFNDYEENDRYYNNHKNTESSIMASLSSSSDPQYSRVIVGRKYEDIEIPLNACLHYSKTTKSLYMDSIIYPWDFLNLVQKVLHEEVTQSMISPNASISKSSIIEEPCKIEDDVEIDDFCKIKGPTYIGKGSFVGMTSLIRNCMFGKDTKIGFNCEIGKSYFAGNDRISHQNVILDSIIGENVWFGGYSGTANVLLTQGNIRYEISKGNLMDTGTNHFGAVVGNNSAIGASVIILPGRQVSANTMIQAGTIFGSK